MDHKRHKGHKFSGFADPLPCAFCAFCGCNRFGVGSIRDARFRDSGSGGARASAACAPFIDSRPLNLTRMPGGAVKPGLAWLAGFQRNPLCEHANRRLFLTGDLS